MAAPYRLSGRVFVFHSYKPSAKLVDACANRIYSPIGCLLDGKNGFVYIHYTEVSTDKSVLRVSNHLLAAISWQAI
jgi:hypothetical protein